MHPFMNQELARQHEVASLREATYERMVGHVQKRTKKLFNSKGRYPSLLAALFFTKYVYLHIKERNS